ncbi:MAG: hypothetical protein ACOCQR_02540 [bacterium]
MFKKLDSRIKKLFQKNSIKKIIVIMLFKLVILIGFIFLLFFIFMQVLTIIPNLLMYISDTFPFSENTVILKAPTVVLFALIATFFIGYVRYKWYCLGKLKTFVTLVVFLGLSMFYLALSMFRGFFRALEANPELIYDSSISVEQFNEIIIENMHSRFEVIIIIVVFLIYFGVKKISNFTLRGDSNEDKSKNPY